MDSSTRIHEDETASLGAAHVVTRRDDDHLTLMRRTTHTPGGGTTHLHALTDDQAAFVEETHAVNTAKIECNVTASKKEAGYTFTVTVPLAELSSTREAIKNFDKWFFTDAFPGGRSPNVTAS